MNKRFYFKILNNNIRKFKFSNIINNLPNKKIKKKNFF